MASLPSASGHTLLKDPGLSADYAAGCSLQEVHRTADQGQAKARRDGEDNCWEGPNGHWTVVRKRAATKQEEIKIP